MGVHRGHLATLPSPQRRSSGNCEKRPTPRRCGRSWSGSDSGGWSWSRRCRRCCGPGEGNPRAGGERLGAPDLPQLLLHALHLRSVHLGLRGARGEPCCGGVAACPGSCGLPGPSPERPHTPASSTLPAWSLSPLQNPLHGPWSLCMACGGRALGGRPQVMSHVPHVPGHTALFGPHPSGEAVATLCCPLLAGGWARA